MKHAAAVIAWNTGVVAPGHRQVRSTFEIRRIKSGPKYECEKTGQHRREGHIYGNSAAHGEMIPERCGKSTRAATARIAVRDRRGISWRDTLRRRGVKTGPSELRAKYQERDRDRGNEYVAPEHRAGVGCVMIAMANELVDMAESVAPVHDGRSNSRG